MAPRRELGAAHFTSFKAMVKKAVDDSNDPF
jgi:hypothetical protein